MELRRFEALLGPVDGWHWIVDTYGGKRVPHTLMNGADEVLYLGCVDEGGCHCAGTAPTFEDAQLIIDRLNAARRT